MQHAEIEAALDQGVAANERVMASARATEADQIGHRERAEGIAEMARRFREKNQAHAVAVRSTMDELLERMSDD